jgi:gamma-butyrobetaine dioxygenase
VGGWLNQLVTHTPFGLPAIWLRDNCQCPACRDPATGERLVSITDLPANISVAALTRSGDRIEIVFSPDGHQSVFDAVWLGQYAAQGEPPGGGCATTAAAGSGRTGAAAAGRGRTAPGATAGDSRVAWELPADGDVRSEDAKRLWSAADIASAFPQGSWPLFEADPTHRQACLASVLRDGLVLLRDVPLEPDTVLTVARRIGLVRESEMGPLVNVEVTAHPSNQVFTSHAMTPRSGLAYRDPVPTVGLTHCLSQAAGGGDSLLVDGFHAAATLRAERPRAFNMLASTEVTFAFADARNDLRATSPVIGLGPSGRIREIRIDTGLMQPLRMPAAAVIDFYDAYRAFAEVIRRPSQAVTIRLRPGDCLVLDNTRLLVGRTRFTGTQRHMQMCWADLDMLASRLSVLRRGRQNGHWRT